MTVKVLVYDDSTEYTKGYADRLGRIKIDSGKLDVKPISIDHFRKEMKELSSRRLATRAEQPIDFGGLEIDEADIFFVDFDLVETFPGEAFLTGEEVCYYARCFSTCKILVGLNQYGRNPFDLTLRGHPESLADLNIDEEQLDNPGLWGGKYDYRPWHWPNLIKSVANFDEKVAKVEADLNKSIMRILGMKDRTGPLARHTEEFLGPQGIEASPKEFAISSGYGLRPKDDKPNGKIIARVTASRISKWLERMVLPGQDVLVDAPHLVSRFPSLLDGNVEEIDDWNKTTSLSIVKDLGVRFRDVEDFRLSDDIWLSRCAWFWRALQNSKDIQEVLKPWTRKPIKYVFAEDASRFYPKSECREFAAEVDSPFVRRYVHYFRDQGIDYTPSSSLM